MSQNLEQLEARVRALELMVGLRATTDPKLIALLEKVCEANGVPVHRVRSHSREGPFIPPRQQFCYLAFIAKFPLTSIAATLRHDFNRAAVQHHAQACEDRLTTEPKFREAMNVLAKEVSIPLPERFQV